MGGRDGVALGNEQRNQVEGEKHVPRNGVDDRCVADLDQRPRQHHHGRHGAKIAPLTNHLVDPFALPSKSATGKRTHLWDVSPLFGQPVRIPCNDRCKNRHGHKGDVFG